MTRRRRRRRRQRRWRARAWAIVRNRRKRERLSRLHKNIVHAILIVAIVVCLGMEGAKWADWGFVCLSIACELS